MSRLLAPALVAALLLAGCASDDAKPDEDATPIGNKQPAPVDARAEAGEAPPFSPPRAKISPTHAAPVEDEASRRRSVR